MTRSTSRSPKRSVRACCPPTHGWLAPQERAARSRFWTGRSSPSSSRARRLDQPACSPGRPWWSVLLTSRKILSQHDPAALGWPRRCASVSPGRGSRDVGVHHPGHAAARRRGGGSWRGDPRGPVALRPAARRHGAGGRGGRDPRQELARTLALEAGKPITQALVEVDRAVQTVTFSAVEARTLAGRGVVVDAHPAGVGRRGWTIRVPIGVVGAITPFNFPLNLAAHKVAPAIAAGCGVVLKPPRQTPLTGIQLAEVLYRAGLPQPWLAVIVGPAAELVDVLVADPRVAMLTFTGSSEVGWGLAARAPRKHVALELGNSTPLIVCADADLDAAAQTTAPSVFNFGGQSCISVQRVIVHASVHDAFLDELDTITL